MDSNTTQWLIVVLFFACFFAAIAVEVRWLSKKHGVVPGKAVAFSFTSSIFCITVGFFVSMVIFFVILAMAWDGSLQDIKGGDASIWGAIAVAAVFPFLILTLAKFLLLKLFKFESITSPLKYSAIASLGFVLAVTVIPFVSVYLLS